MAKILVVDDDSSIRDLVSGILVDEGHRVASAQDGRRALDMMLIEAPDLVLLDVMMPELDGYSVLRDMKNQGLREKTKVIFFTAKNAEADWLRGYRLGADHYLPKPFELDELIGSVHRILSMSKEELAKKREQELDRAQLLSRLESFFDA